MEDYWSQHVNDWEESNNIILYYFTDVSLAREIDRVISDDIPIVLLAFLIMLIYLSLTMDKLHYIYSRPYLAIISLLSTISALLIGFGIGSALGFTFNVIGMVTTFIIIVIGVDDDMYVPCLFN